MSAVANILSSANASATDLVGEWMPKILVKQGRSANLGSVLYGFFAKLKAEQALNGTFNSFERDPVRSNFFSNAAAIATATTLTFDDGNANPVVALLATGSILQNGRTLEIVRVADDPATNLTTTQVTVTRNITGDGVNGQAINQGDVWSRITEGALEGAAPRRAAYEQPNVITNYIQTFKSSAYLSNYYCAGQVRSNLEGPKQDAINYALEQIVNQIEKGLLVGPKVPGSANQEQLTGGVTTNIDAAIAANSNLAGIKLNGNAGAGVTLDAFLLWLDSFMVNGSEAKLALCGDQAYSALSRFANSNAGGFRIMNNSGEKFSVNLKEIETPSGTLTLARHPLLMKDLNYRGHMIVVDLGLVGLKVMEKLHYQEFEPSNGTDAYQGQFRAKQGLQMSFAEANGYAYNLQQING